MDELAALVQQDPLAFRERNLTDARLRAVLRAAAERFGWGSAQAGGRPRRRPGLRHREGRLRRLLRGADRRARRRPAR